MARGDLAEIFVERRGKDAHQRAGVLFHCDHVPSALDEPVADQFVEVASAEREPLRIGIEATANFVEVDPIVAHDAFDDRRAEPVFRREGPALGRGQLARRDSLLIITDQDRILHVSLRQAANR